jgi:hypothetical protein
LVTDKLISTCLDQKTKHIRTIASLLRNDHHHQSIQHQQSLA